MPVSSSDEEEYVTIDSQEMQPDPHPNDHDLPATIVVNYLGDVNVLVDEINGCKRFLVDAGPSVGQYLSTSCLVDPAYNEPEVFFSSHLNERMCTTIVEQYL